MDTTLNASRRDSRGKNEARRLRAAGRIPGVVYGAGETIAVSVDPKVLSRILHSESGANTLITLNVEGAGTSQVLVKEFQLDPIHHQMQHADFYRVSMDKVIQVTVPIALKGEPRGVKQQGGLLDFPNREIEIECLPGEIPESIEIDVSELLIGQGVRLRDIAEGARWTSLSDPDLMLVHVVPPRAEEVAEPAPEVTPAPAAEPEVIKKGKPEKEE
jgi:large subunit ribosomal protein L25